MRCDPALERSIRPVKEHSRSDCEIPNHSTRLAQEGAEHGRWTFVRDRSKPAAKRRTAHMLVAPRPPSPATVPTHPPKEQLEIVAEA